MLGVSRLARFGKIYYWLGQIGFFHKSLWLDLLPEYDPHKYNSFPMNAPRQSLALTSLVNRQIRRMRTSGALNAMPPVLTFQSLVDSTVIAQDVVARLYDRLPARGSELVLFDINREGVLDVFVDPAQNQFIEQLRMPGPRNYALTVVSNRDRDTLYVDAFMRGPHQTEFARLPLELSWPENMYSLSHVAMPFPPDDPVYGFDAPMGEGGFPRLGRAQMTGENGALTLPASLFTRARSNPFHDYVEQRIAAWIEGD
jgi:alpha-beta hydrolase superfamily lysophospholipase